jgi:hypothetical protein
MTEDDWFYINDFEDFVDNARSLVFKFFGDANKEEKDIMAGLLSKMTTEEIEELNSTLTHEESAAIISSRVRKQIHKKTKKTRYCLNDQILATIIEDLNGRMISNMLNSLVNKGFLDSAYDSDQNDFIFWVKEEDDTKSNQKPETD